jgi:hypothetical protein
MQIMARVDDLRSDYDVLGELLRVADGSAAAAIARERRLIGELLEQMESPEALSYVDELAARRSDAGDIGPPARRRRS